MQQELGLLGGWPTPYSVSPFYEAVGAQLSGLGLSSACSVSAPSAHVGSSAASASGQRSHLPRGLRSCQGSWEGVEPQIHK